MLGIQCKLTQLSFVPEISVIKISVHAQRNEIKSLKNFAESRFEVVVRSQYYKRNLVLKKSKLVLNFLTECNFNFDYITIVLLWSELKYRTIK